MIDEGHTGVALFMALSGYLFAKLLDGRNISYPAFFWNRALRLLPLLVVTIVIDFVLNEALLGHHFDIAAYARSIGAGLIEPTLPNGGWSITVEIHFYLLLPLILAVTRQWKLAPLAVIPAFILMRAILFAQHGTVEHLAYFTLIGRADQFLFGIAAFQLRRLVADRHLLAVAVAVAFGAFYYWIDRSHAYDELGGRISNSPIWIFLPTVEGFTYATLIAYYDNTFAPKMRGFSRVLSQYGKFSYSIYLLHFFVAFRMSLWINHRIMPLHNFYVALGADIACFSLMFIPGWLSYRYIESPFLRLRTRYAGGKSRSPELVRAS